MTIKTLSKPQKPQRRFKKKAMLAILTLTSFFSLMACQSADQMAQTPLVTFLTPEASQAAATKATSDHLFTVSDTPGAALRFSIRLSQPEPDFETKIVPCDIDSDLDELRLYLIRSDTSLGTILPITLGPLLNTVEGPFSIGKKSLSSPSGSESFVFKNVTEGKYYVAMSAHTSSGINITGASLTNPTGLLGGVNLVAVSNGGGNVASPGRVEVGPAPNFLILNGTEATLTLNLELSSLNVACL